VEKWSRYSDGLRAETPGLGCSQSDTHGMETGSGAHPTFYPVDTGAFFREGVRQSRCKAETINEVKSGETIPPRPLHLHGVVCN
jgi:hypothetical protein